MKTELDARNVVLIPYTIECLEKSWVWLNDPVIRELTMTPRFSKEEQLMFFQTLRERVGYDIWGVALEEHGLIGAAGLKNQRASTAEYWGYIGEQRFWGKGLGKSLIAEVENKALGLGFQELDLKVSVANTRANALYLKAGFVVDHGESNPMVLRMVKKLR